MKTTVTRFYLYSTNLGAYALPKGEEWSFVGNGGSLDLGFESKEQALNAFESFKKGDTEKLMGTISFIDPVSIKIFKKFGIENTRSVGIRVATFEKEGIEIKTREVLQSEFGIDTELDLGMEIDPTESNVFA